MDGITISGKSPVNVFKRFGIYQDITEDKYHFCGMQNLSVVFKRIIRNDVKCSYNAKK